MASNNNSSLSREASSSSPSRCMSQEMSHRKHFPFRLYDMLEYASEHGHNSAVSWSDDGRAFIVHQEEIMEIVPLFFKLTKFRSFTRQLNLWGFTPNRIRGTTTWAHRHFIRGNIDGLKSIERVEVKMNGALKGGPPKVVTIAPKTTALSRGATRASTIELSTDVSISSKETDDRYSLADIAPLAFARNIPVQPSYPSIDTEDILQFLLSDALGFEFLLSDVVGSTQMFQDDDLCSILSLNETSDEFMNPYDCFA